MTFLGIKSLYDVLELNESATENDIKRAYKALALKYHPDKNNAKDDGIFKNIKHAYDILSDPEKRRIYDLYGEEENDEFDERQYADGFSKTGYWFRNHGKSSNRRGFGRKPDPVERTLFISLQDTYCGKQISLVIEKSLHYNSKRRSRVPDDHRIYCVGCEGKGFKTQLRQFSEMAKSFETSCITCCGTGILIKCKGQKQFGTKQKIDIFIERGIKSGHKIILNGYGDEVQGGISGDIIISFEILDHKVFKRKDNDLEISLSIPFHEALCGSSASVTHLDGRKIIIRSKPGDIIKPDQRRVIRGEGMPLSKKYGIRGDLYVNYNVQFPDFLSDSQIIKLMQIFPRKEQHIRGMDVYEYFVEQKENFFDFKHKQEEEEGVSANPCSQQ
jgi:DnaJ family protein A protein 2